MRPAPQPIQFTAVKDGWWADRFPKVALFALGEIDIGEREGMAQRDGAMLTVRCTNGTAFYRLSGERDAIGSGHVARLVSVETEAGWDALVRAKRRESPDYRAARALGAHVLGRINALRAAHA